MQMQGADFARLLIRATKWSFDVASFAKSLVERRQIWSSQPGESAEVADHRHRSLLRAERVRRRRYRAAEQEHQLAAVHSMTSSSWGRSVGRTYPAALRPTTEQRGIRS